MNPTEPNPFTPKEQDRMAAHSENLIIEEDYEEDEGTDITSM